MTNRTILCKLGVSSEPGVCKWACMQTSRLPEVESVEEDGKAEEHGRPQTDDECAGPGKVECDLLAEVVAYLPERLEATRPSPTAGQVMACVLTATSSQSRRRR